MSNVAQDLRFIQDHPAIGLSDWKFAYSLGFNFFVNECCKRGVTEIGSYLMYINEGHECWDQLKHKADEYGDVRTDYKELYGEDWSFDHVEYYSVVDFVACLSGKVSWSCYPLATTTDRTFEGLIAKNAKIIRENLGDYNILQFQVKREDYPSIMEMKENMISDEEISLRWQEDWGRINPNFIEKILKRGKIEL